MDLCFPFVARTSIDGGDDGAGESVESDDVDVLAGRRFWTRKIEPREEDDCVERREESAEKNYCRKSVSACLIEMRRIPLCYAYLVVGNMSACHRVVCTAKTERYQVKRASSEVASRVEGTLEGRK